MVDIMDDAKEVLEHSKYKELLVGKLNYFDLNTVEKTWYLYLKKSYNNSFEDIVTPVLELGTRVWEKGILYEVVNRNGWNIILVKLDDVTKKPLNIEIEVDEETVSYEKEYNRKKRTFVLDDPTDEELKRINEVFQNEEETRKEERSKGSNSLVFKNGTVGEKVYDVISNFSRGFFQYTRSEPYDTPLKRVVIRNKEENIEIDWDDFPRDKRQAFIDLNYKESVDYINDYFETRYIYMKVSLKSYVPKEELRDGVETIL